MDAKYAGYVFLLCIFTQVELKTQHKPIEFTGSNWNEAMKGEWMVLLVSEGCADCEAFKPTFESLAKWSQDLNFNLGIVDISKSPELDDSFLIESMPTLYHVSDGQLRRYNGEMQEEHVIAFMRDKAKKKLGPASYWTHLYSLHMSVMDWFFSTAMRVREFFSTMTNEYDIPESYCYLVFAVLTMTIGLLCVLMIVCCCDFWFPSRYHPPGEVRPDLSKSEEEFLNRDTPDIIDDAARR